MSRLHTDSRQLPPDPLDLQPPAKRTRLQQRMTDEQAATAALARIHTSLVPVRLLFLGFLEDGDAARLMRVSGTFTSAVLAGYAFLKHVFVVKTRLQLRRLVSIYKRYRLLITRMALSASFNSSLVNSRGKSLLPSSLIALMLGYQPAMFLDDSRFFALADSRAGASQKASRRRQREEVEERMDRGTDCNFPSVGGAFNSPLVPGSLPKGLRFLQLGNEFDQPLPRHVFPCSLFFIQFGHAFDQETVFDLPETVTHVVLHWLGYSDQEIDMPERYGCFYPEELLDRMPSRQVCFTGAEISDTDSEYECNCMSWHGDCSATDCGHCCRSTQPGS